MMYNPKFWMTMFVINLLLCAANFGLYAGYGDFFSLLASIANALAAAVSIERFDHFREN